MINNPLLNGSASGPAPTCPTGWHDMRFPSRGYKGHSELTLTAADIVRVLDDTRMASRLYHPKGDVAGLFTDRCEFRMVGKAGKRGKLMADAPGIQLLKGKLPWSKHPVEMDKDTLFGAMGIQFYPFSTLSHVVVTGPMGSDMLGAMVKAYRLDAMQLYGGLPVLGCPDGDVSGLEAVRWPQGLTLLAMTDELADAISDVLFEVDVEVWSL